MPHLFEPLRLRGLELPNRIGMTPMCQYSAIDGVPQDWHLVHYGARAAGGPGLVIVEATAVTADGRISPGDLGIWDQRHIEPLARLARQVRAQGCVAGIQLAHAGRKASAGLGWEAQRTLAPAEGGWRPLAAPSALAFGEGYAEPAALDEAGIQDIVEAFVAAARRALVAGFQVAELHAAHGYLMHQFLSPIANQRTDRWGGPFAHRIRLPLEVARALRAVWPEHLPLMVRLSATDWVEGGWDIEQTVEFARCLKGVGVDLIDVSSGGMVPTARIPAGPGFQTGFAQRVRHEAGVATATVGMITVPAQADHIVRSGQADVVLLGRELLRNPLWPLAAAQALGAAAPWPRQYLRAAPAGSPARAQG